MKNNILILTSLLVFFFNVSSVTAGDRILSIQSIDITPYQEALKGFQSVCSTDIERFIISEMKEKDIIKEIRKKNPSIILSIGMDALEKIKDINDIPVIYLMVPNPKPVSEKTVNLTGVRMNIRQEDQISSFLKAVPSMKTIGLLYNPDRTGYLAQRAIDACKKAGVTPIGKEIRTSRDTPSAIKGLEGRIDGFWMLPDVTVFTSEGLEYLFLFSMKNKVPILTFSEVYLESGAMISIGVDSFDMGVQAGEMALEILSGRSVFEIQPADARKEVIMINLKVSGKLGIPIDEALFAKAKFFR
jgi:putative tryptophan/tyrosine transport system substrate-binding protein